jgi:hypothetical protein
MTLMPSSWERASPNGVSRAVFTGMVRLLMQFTAGTLCVFAMSLVAACGVPDAPAAADGPVAIGDPAAVPDTVWHHGIESCNPTDFADVPVRPFLGDGGKTVYWFASAWPNYYATKGVATQGDILSGMKRVRNPDGSCKQWVVSGAYGSRFATPDSYNTGLWMQAPYTPDGTHVIALVHNEFHGELTAPPGAGSRYCTTTQATFLLNNGCSYWNTVGAISNDGGDTFHLFKRADGSNAPVLVSPRPYLLPADNNGRNPGLSGMVTVTNIVHWGKYYYVLVQSIPSQDPNRGYGQPVGRNGMCIYRTETPLVRESWRGWDGKAYTVGEVPDYPSGVEPRYACTPVVSGMYRFSWSFNVVLGQFILIGIDQKFGQSDRKPQAIVYTTARLNPDGEFIQTSGEHMLREINWLDRWRVNPSITAEAYPSLLDPASPEIGRRLSSSSPSLAGTPDLNFQYSGAHPYLYFVMLYPRSLGDGTRRDIVRQRLTVTR